MVSWESYSSFVSLLFPFSIHDLAASKEIADRSQKIDDDNDDGNDGHDDDNDDDDDAYDDDIDDNDDTIERDINSVISENKHNSNVE